MLYTRTIGLLLLFAVSVMLGYGYQERASFDSVFGGMGNCKGPCSHVSLTSLIECLDLPPDSGIVPSGGGQKTANGCWDHMCVINNLRFIRCTSGAGEDEDCYWGWDEDDWQRKIVIRKMPCTDGGFSEITYGSGVCEGDPRPDGTHNIGVDTPCISSECWGELVDNVVHDWGRPICDEP